MKIKLILLSLFASLSVFGQVYTNGVFVHEGKTVEVTKKVYSLATTNKSETYQFSNGFITQIGTNTDFSVNSFFQTVTNFDGNPHKSQFGSANLATSLVKGTAFITYSGNTNEESSCVVSTPLMDVELFNGTFYFVVTDTKVIVVVLDGSLKSHVDGKKENVVTAGYATIATPSDIGFVEDKISLITEKVKQSNFDVLVKQSSDVVSLKNSVIFATINKKLVGIVIN